VQSIAKIEAHEEEPPPIYLPPQQQKEPSLLTGSNFKGMILNFLSEFNQMANSLQEMENTQF
jgi:hypothetical protein